MPRRDRGTVRIQISILPHDLVELDALAAELTEPGLVPNRSAAFRKALRSYLASGEADRAADRAPERG